MNYKNYHRDTTYKEEESHFRNIFQKRVDIILEYLKPSQKKVIDIGTSTGIMLDIFKDLGFETWGVEPSQSAKIAKDKGHKITKSYFEDAKLPKNYFDVIVMNHTLEHLSNPLKVLKKIHQILTPDGYLLIDVPNAGGFGSKLLKDKWPYKLPKEHKSQFTKKCLSKIFRQAGFQVVHFESRSGIFEFANPVKEVFEALIHGKKRFFKDLINIPYDIFVTFFDAGDSMTLIGRKESV